MTAKHKYAVGLIFGGPSSEHSISCLSAMNIWDHLDTELYEKKAIGWNQEGFFYTSSDINDLLSSERDAQKICVTPHKKPIHLLELNLDLIFPIVHGQGGEDGSLQGHLNLLNIPYVGANVQGCVLTWHKGLCKQILHHHGINVTPWVVCRRGESFKEKLDQFDYPVFVKPACSGSAIAVNRVTDDEKLFEAMETAWLHSKDILIELEIKGRELECAILNGQASPVGEIVKHSDFYDFEAKYLNDTDATPDINPTLPKQLEKTVQDLAVKAANMMNCSSFCRVDFFYDETNKNVYLNEINTHPGFTSISMYPKLWEKAGLPMNQLINQLIDRALPNHIK